MIVRDPINPGRYHIIGEDGQDFFALLYRADGATKDGTNIDADMFVSETTAQKYGFTQATVMPDLLFAIIKDSLNAQGLLITSNAEALVAEIARAKARENELNTAINEETTARISAVSGVQSNLNSEVTRSKAAEQVLQDNIDAESGRAKQAEQTLQSNITAESDRAKAAEQINAEAIQQESTRAQLAEQNITTSLTNKITAETERATTAESLLQEKITDESLRAQEAESDLSARITAENSRATTAEENLQYNITAETTRSKAEETRLEARVDTEREERIGENIISGAYVGNTLVLQRSNTNTLNVQTPVSSEARDGFLSRDDFIALRTLEGTVTGLTSGWKIAGFFGQTPSQAELTAFWVSVFGDEPIIGAIIINLDQTPPRGHDWFYLVNTTGSREWFDRGVAGGAVDLATNNTPGIVQGSDIPGNMFVNVNGTMSLVGWDSIQTELLTLQSDKVDKTTELSFTGDITSSAQDLSQSRVFNVTLSDTGVVSGSYGQATSIVMQPNDTFIIPFVVVDGAGRITSIQNKTLTLPNVYIPEDATTAKSGLMPASAVIKLNTIETGAQVNTVTSVAGRHGAIELTPNDIVGTTPVNKGGTGATNTSDALINLFPSALTTNTASPLYLTGAIQIAAGSYTVGKLSYTDIKSDIRNLSVGTDPADSGLMKEGDVYIQLEV